MSIRTFRIGTPRHPRDGLRLGTVRFLPRGVKKSDYARRNYFDVWLPVLAPSRQLVRWVQGRSRWGARERRSFESRYAREIASRTDARQTLQLIARLSRKTDLSVGCYCADETRCHRPFLLKLIRATR